MYAANLVLDKAYFPYFLLLTGLKRFLNPIIATNCMKHKQEIADFVDVPEDLKRHVIGTGGNTLRSIQERSGAKVFSLSRAEEGFWVKGTKEQRKYAKNLILEMVVSSRLLWTAVACSLIS